MFDVRRKLFPIVVIGLIASVQLPEIAEARATIESRELVSRQRVGRGEYLYSFALSINNDGPALNDVTVYVNCEANGATLVDDIVEFGDIAEDAVTTSTDTFSIRVNRRIRFNPDCLVYEIGFDTPLIISGLATDNPLALAEITATVIRPESGRPIIDSGRPIIDSYSTFADDQGNYTLEIEAITQDDFITLSATGTGEQSEAELTSSLGTVGELHDVGASGSIIVDAAAFGSLNITHITTAQDELVRRLNGGVLPQSDGELAALRSQIDGARLLTMASLIKSIVDNPEVTLPPGISSTLELIQNPVVYEETLADVQENFPDQYNEAIAATAANLNIGFLPGDVPGVLYAVIQDEQPFTSSSYVFEFDANGGGSVVFGDGDSPLTWTINGDGELLLTLLDPPVIESFPFIEDVEQQVLARTSTLSMKLIKLTDGPVYDQAFVLERILTTYPENPSLDDEIDENQPAPEFVHVTFGPSGTIPIEFEELAGESVASYYFHESNAPLGVALEGLGADTLNFGEEGSGSTSRTGLGFAWSIGDDGSLGLTFDNGDATRFVRFAESGPVAQVVLLGALASTGEVQSIASEAINDMGDANFTTQELENRRYASLSTILDPNSTFDFLFLPGGEGCRFSSFEGPEFVDPFVYESTPENLMFLSRSLEIEGEDIEFRQRAWEAIAVVPGVLGDRYWVVENLLINLELDTDYEFPDPLVTPGRINSYEFVEDLSAVDDPCGFEPSPPLRLTANGTIFSREELPGLPLPVDGAVGTPFSISWDLDTEIDPQISPGQLYAWEDVIRRLAFATPSSSDEYRDNLGIDNTVSIGILADRSYYTIGIGVDVPQAPYRYSASMLLNGPTSLDIDEIGQLDPRPLSQWDAPALFTNNLGFSTCPLTNGACSRIFATVDSITFEQATTTATISVLSNNAFLVLPDGSTTALDQGGEVEFEVADGGGNVQLYSCGWPDPPYSAGCRFIDYTVFRGERWEVVDAVPFPRIIMQRVVD